MGEGSGGHGGCSSRGSCSSISKITGLALSTLAVQALPDGSICQVYVGPHGPTGERHGRGESTIFRPREMADSLGVGRVADGVMAVMAAATNYRPRFLPIQASSWLICS